ncbi:glycosyltransferase family 2 protein [Paraclostridium bifermentans]|uniref:glycosyltransferase family 2 protein n=1 Tax=Paraclostridium bifermentans TaxID=1490 RepID=UPI002431C22F|nr:glycosyltransferase family 2 protein [Paraclostridium bifermentans]
MYKISVIIPVYKVELFIERCAKSLFEQTLDSIEYIFVDDCSPDNSIPILKNILTQYPQRIKDTKIISHNTNRGLAAARKTGLSLATGEYIIHCDSDDWVEVNAYEILYKAAIDNNSDIIICDIFHATGKGKKCICTLPPVNNIELINAFLNGNVHASLCNKLVKREIYVANNIEPIENINYLEDMSIMYKLVYYSNKITYINKPLYNYFIANYSSYTHAPLSIESQRGMLILFSQMKTFLHETGLYLNFKKGIQNFSIAIKGNILLNANSSVDTSVLNNEFKILNIINHPQIGFFTKLAIFFDLIKFKFGIKVIRFMKKLVSIQNWRID